MIEISLRVYAELNDYLPEELRKKEFKLSLQENSTVNDILLKLGIPKQEVHLVLINSENSLLDRILKHGDRVSIYPIFETIDISPIKIVNITGLIDTHVHLDEIDNLQETFNDARYAGVESIVAVGVNRQSNQKILELAYKCNEIKVYPALGIHPTEINNDEIDVSIKFIKENIDSVIAIGEIGLDFWYNVNKELQYKVFRIQLELAEKYNKPVIIHSRGAWEECFEIVKEYKVDKAIFHWYSGPQNVLEKIVQSGYFISATPALEYSSHHINAVKNVPIEKIVVETDSPVRYKTVDGKTYVAKPKDVIKPVIYISRIKNLPVNEVIKIIKENTIKFFNF